MASPLIQTSSDFLGDGGSGSVTLGPNPVGDGHTIFLAFNEVFNGAAVVGDVTSIEDNLGNKYNLEGFQSGNTSGQASGIWVYSCYDAIGGTLTASVVWAGGGSFADLAIYEYPASAGTRSVATNVVADGTPLEATLSGVVSTDTVYCFATQNNSEINSPGTIGGITANLLPHSPAGDHWMAQDGTGVSGSVAVVANATANGIGVIITLAFEAGGSSPPPEDTIFFSNNF